MAKAKANLGWLEEAQSAVNSSADYRRLGTTDVVLGLAIGDEARLVKFEAFEVADISAIAANDLRDAGYLLQEDRQLIVDRAVHQRGFLCGLGFEIALVLPAIVGVRRRWAKRR